MTRYQYQHQLANRWRQMTDEELSFVYLSLRRNNKVIFATFINFLINENKTYIAEGTI